MDLQTDLSGEAAMGSGSGLRVMVLGGVKGVRWGYGGEVRGAYGWGAREQTAAPDDFLHRQVQQHKMGGRAGIPKTGRLPLCAS